MIFFFSDLVAKGCSEDGARRLLRLGRKVAGNRCISMEDLEKEYARSPRIKPDSEDILSDPPLGEDRGQDDGYAAEQETDQAFGVGKHKPRSRRRSKKQSLRIIEGGTRGMDSQEVCQ